MTVKHPAPYSDALIGPIVAMLEPWVEPGGRMLYDPMAGTGERLRMIAKLLTVDCCGCEIEPEFIVDNGIFPIDCTTYTEEHPVILTSPAYGNRMADQYLGTPIERATRAASGKMPRRRSYAIALGRQVALGSGARWQWAENYRRSHEAIMRHIVKVNLTSNGVFLLNVASHFRATVYQPVAEWYLATLIGLGLKLIDYRFELTPGFRDGQNRELRVGGEHLYLFQKEMR
jgi:hypothetical protein